LDANGLASYRFENLSGHEGLAHAVFGRLGGVSSAPFATLNVGGSVGDTDAAVADNHQRIYAYLGLDSSQVAMAQQVHGNQVAVVGVEDGGRVRAYTDGLVTATPGVGLILRFADCQPIILYDPVRHALGLVHAGWRGVALGIALRAVEAMEEAFGCCPSDLVAGLGPAIGPCCYEVGHSVAAAMGYALPNWTLAMESKGDRWHLDLSAANTQHLSAAGVEKIERSSLCTACHSDEFYSHRASGGKTGRFAVVAYLKALHGARRAEASGEDRFEPQAPEPAPLLSASPPGMPTFQESLGEHE
jgi:YfiH family protein